MPPRYAYWTIIAGGLPTAFRAADRDELLPTFQRIKEKHPDAQMKWFARGKLWESQDAARIAEKRGGRGRARLDEAGHDSQRRSRDWRPGGEHRDPRQKFVDAKKQRNVALRKERWRRAQDTDEPNQPPRPRGPNREPRPSETPRPTPPPRPAEPTVPPPGPAEQGRKPARRPFQSRGRFPKGPRR